MSQKNFKICDQPACAHCQKFDLSALLVTPVQAGAAIGYSKQSTYNLLSDEDFPISVVKVRNRKMVRVADLIKFVDELYPDSTPAQQSRRPGRPTKEESIQRVTEKKGVKI